MIFKCLLILPMILLTGLLSYGQNKPNIVRSSIRYDVDSLPVLKADFTQDTMYLKYFISSSWQDVYNTFHYKGGYEALLAYCDSLYFKRESDIDEEPNGMALYTILFDENLKIKDVRILKRLTYNNSKYDYDTLVKRILWSTEGKWEKEDSNDHCKWYLYMGYFKVR
ncbi:hypothetical protein [Coprobacter tertius]|uniref:Uncharacterized protein n=1 Tax=Coprobacter tertius TaxID=2944915 RepID=A0ABT1MDX2_9BACT|nr:hypothetical protein [Coprobacter tertius]MCP9610825.1 hypothetical protein [Coprobacter tertius]